MAPLAPFVFQSTTSTGTGNLALQPEPGHREAAGAFGTGAGNTFAYYIRRVDAAEWEYGTGYVNSGGELVRSSVAESSAGQGTAVAFSAGTKVVTADVDLAELRTALDHPGLGGTGAHPAATTTTAGFMAAADKTKLNGITAGADATPAGVLVELNGGTGAVPQGWVLADGSNGTPDLSHRFSTTPTLVEIGVATGEAETSTISFDSTPDTSAGDTLLINGTEHTVTSVAGTDVTIDPSLPATQGVVVEVGDSIEIAGNEHRILDVVDEANLEVDVAPPAEAGDVVQLFGQTYEISSITDADTFVLDQAPPSVPVAEVRLPVATIRVKPPAPTVQTSGVVRPAALSVQVHTPAAQVGTDGAIQVPAVRLVTRADVATIGSGATIRPPALSVGITTPAPLLKPYLDWGGRRYEVIYAKNSAVHIDVTARAQVGDTFDFNGTEYSITGKAGNTVTIDPVMPFDLDHAILKRATEAERVWIMKS